MFWEGNAGSFRFEPLSNEFDYGFGMQTDLVPSTFPSSGIVQLDWQATMTV